MIRGFAAVYYRELLILKRRLTRMLASMSVSPLLFLIAFGYAIGRDMTVEGHTYMEYLLPGLCAMSSMTQSFSIASEINIARFYWHIFEEFQAAPVGKAAYVAGEVAAGMTRAVLSVSVIIVLGTLFGVFLAYGPLFWLAVLLNAFVFSSLAVGLAMLVKSHADQAMINNFVITPMAFLGGTFFPADRLPSWVGGFVSLLPLTHAAGAVRAAAFGNLPAYGSYLLLLCLGCACFAFAWLCVDRAKD
jgi:ABC-type multidrug transport system permease subunit